MRGLQSAIVKRSRVRFPTDFLFQLTAPEKAGVVANCDHLQKLNHSRDFRASPPKTPSFPRRREFSASRRIA